jgi:hypothetical protein
LNTGNSETKDIYVYDVLGKVVYHKTNLSNKTIDITITDAPKGIYVVKVKSENSIRTRKIMNQ